MNNLKAHAIAALAALTAAGAFAVESPVDYVNTLVGSQSKHSLSTGNTYPAIALPWGLPLLLHKRT